MAVRLSMPWLGKADSAAGGTSGDSHGYTEGSSLLGR